MACAQTGRDCVYAETADGRRHRGRDWASSGEQNERSDSVNNARRQRKRLRSLEECSNSSRAETPLRGRQQSTARHPTSADEESEGDSDATSGATGNEDISGIDGHSDAHNGTEPWGVGGLALARNGNLILTPEATWYRSMQPMIETPPSHASLAAADWSTSTFSVRPSHQAHYLPMVLSADDHTRLVDEAFTGPLALGMNAWRGAFIAAMETYCGSLAGHCSSSEGDPFPSSVLAVFSPALHLAVLFYGLRFCTDEALVRRYLGPGEEHRYRGMIFLEASRVQAAEEAARPHLSTITAHLLLSSAYVGMSHE